MRQILFAMMLVLAVSFSVNAQMINSKAESSAAIVIQPPPKQVTRRITGYNITLLGSGFGKLLGWIQLKDGTADAGYIYLTDQDPMPKDYLGSSDYVVMHQRAAMLDSLLSILRNEKNLQIRFYDSGDGQPPSTFLEQTGNTNLDKPSLNK